jgi:hypothetical protein
MFTPRDILLGVVLPTIVSSAILVIGRFIARASADWIAPLAISVAFASGFVGLIGWKSFPPVDSVDWFPFLVLVLGAFAIAGARWRLPTWGRRMTFVFEAVLAVALLAWPLVRNAEHPAREVGLLAAIVAALVLSWYSIERVSGDDGGWPAVELCCAIGLAAITLMMSSSKKLGQLGGVFAASIVPFAFVQVSGRQNMIRRGTVPFVLVFVGGLLLCGNAFADLTALGAVLLWAGLMAIHVRRLPPVNRWSELRQIAIGLTAVLALAGSAAALAAVAFARSMSEYGY